MTTPFVKLFMKLFGIATILVGIAGFFVGGSLMGFAMSPLRNIAHIIIGILALGVSGSYGTSRMVMIALGLLFGVVAIVGFTMGGDIFGLYQVNADDNLLHLGVSVVLLLIGFSSKKKV